MTVKIYRDDAANAVFVEDNNGAQFLNNLQAVTDSPSDAVFRIRDRSRDNLLLSNLGASDIVDENDQVYGADVQSVVNSLNTVFSVSGTPSGAPPVITSPLTVNMTAGDVLNYELVATGGVGYEWGNLPAGVVTIEGNVRKLIGGSGLSPATYNITATAINYFGQDSETIVLDVASPPYSNTKSVRFNSNDYLDAPATTSNPFYRASNGSGAADAWSVSFWVKKGSSTSSLRQTIVSFGGNYEFSEGHVQVYYTGNDSRVGIVYGTFFNNLTLETPSSSLATDTWHHLLITYDGGTTGVSSGSINDYYSRFALYLDGSLQTTTNTNSNYGFAGEIEADVFRIGEASFGSDHMRNGTKVDEVALWASDQSSNAAAIYNSGITFDLSTLGTAPDHWWRMGDGDAFPDLQDNVGSLDFTMYNMTAADIVTDAP